MSKILIVSHQFLPHQSPRTTRWKMIYEELINRGHEVIVLTGTPQEEKKEPDVKRNYETYPNKTGSDKGQQNR